MFFFLNAISPYEKIVNIPVRVAQLDKKYQKKFWDLYTEMYPCTYPSQEGKAHD